MVDYKHKIQVGISSCLLGHEVRYDGGHKSNDYIRKTLSQYFELRPFCPELESGMSVPRPPFNLGIQNKVFAVSELKIMGWTLPNNCSHVIKNSITG